MDNREEMSGATGMQQWNKRRRSKMTAMSKKQKGIKQDYQVEFWTGSHKANNLVFH
jgi:hypothetical protein